MSQGFDPIKAQTMAALYDRFVYDVEEKQRMLRGVEAMGYGLNPHEYSRPFPRPVPMPMPVSANASQQSFTAAKVLPIAAALLLGGGTIGAGVVGLASLLGGSGQSGTVSAAVTPAEYEVIFESDGKQLRVEKAKE